MPRVLLSLTQRSSSSWHSCCAPKAVFSTGPNDIGRTSLVQHDIMTQPGVPVKQPLPRMALEKQQSADQQIQQSLEGGLARRSHSSWSSLIVMLRKKDGTYSLCIDYRALNDCSIKDMYPLPCIQDTLDTLSTAKWFTTLDLASGYWQVELTKKHARFQWTEDCQAAFNKLKRLLTAAPLLGYLLDQGNMILDTDGSDVSIGAVLSRVQNGEECVGLWESQAFENSTELLHLTARTDSRGGVHITFPAVSPGAGLHHAHRPQQPSVANKNERRLRDSLPVRFGLSYQPDAESSGG